MFRRLAWYLSLARASNLPTVWSNACAAWALGGGGWDGRALGLLALAGSLLYAGGCTLNDAFDAAWDKQHRPERAIPSGALSAAEVWLVGGVELLGGLLILTQFGWTVVCSGGVVAVAIVLYDWWHKQSVWSVLLMGWCRAQWVFTAALAAPHPMRTLGFALALFLYILGVSLTARSESHSEGQAKRPHSWVLSLGFLLLAGTAVWLKVSWQAWLAAGLVFGSFAGWFFIARRGMEERGKAGIGRFVSRSLAGVALGDSAFACLVWGWWGLSVACFWPLCLLLQRRIAAT